MLKRTQHISRPIIEEDIGDRVLVKWFFFVAAVPDLRQRHHTLSLN